MHPGHLLKARSVLCSLSSYLFNLSLKALRPQQNHSRWFAGFRHQAEQSEWSCLGPGAAEVRLGGNPGLALCGVHPSLARGRPPLPRLSVDPESPGPAFSSTPPTQSSMCARSQNENTPAPQSPIWTLLLVPQTHARTGVCLLLSSREEREERGKGHASGLLSLCLT